jgi:ATP-dependent Clp protease ATP-binding subunit ClpA
MAAQAQARELGHHYVRPEHLVLGLLALPEELAAEALARLGVTADCAREAVEQRLGRRAPRPNGSLGVAPPTKRLLEMARAVAKPLGHRCPRTEHILLAAVTPSLQSPAAAVLAECGAPPARVRDEVARMLVNEAPELAERLTNPSLWSRVRLRF